MCMHNSGVRARSSGWSDLGLDPMAQIVQKSKSLRSYTLSGSRADSIIGTNG
jgi:hypothetical protein